MGDDPAIIAKRKCLKCDLPAAYYSQNPKQAVYCKQCFINMVHHKFSYVLGKNRIFKDGSSKDVLLVWKDSLPDNFLLETVKTGVNQDVHKRLEAQPQVLVILESAQTEQLKAEYEKALKRKDELNMPWQWNFIHFSEVFKQDIEFIYDEPTIDQGKASVLKYLFGKASAKNDRLEFKRLLTELLIYRAAKALKIEKVMVSDCAEKTAQNSFDALCFGRGSSISQLTAPVDTRFPTVSIIRPLREIYDAEIKLVLRLESLLNDFEEIKLDQVHLKSSKTVQEMNVEFLSKLQASGFPSTLTSVVSTSSKIRAPPNSAAINSCCLCYEKCESIDYCPACDRLLKAIPSFPDELRSFLSTLAK
jgi:hypothetical protein